MRYKTRIVPENGGYVGYALLNEEVVFTTNNHKDAVMAAREISAHITAASQQQPAAAPAQRFMKSTDPVPAADNLVPVKRNNVASQPAPQAPPPQPPVPRRCCGR